MTTDLPIVKTTEQLSSLASQPPQPGSACQAGAGGLAAKFIPEAGFIPELELMCGVEVLLGVENSQWPQSLAWRVVILLYL